VEIISSSRTVFFDKIIVRFLGVIFFTVFSAIGAHLYIPLPFTPVPITLQTFSVFLSGVVLGKKYGSVSQLIYILLGLVGLPFFAGGSAGFVRLLGPTGGYLIGFVVCSFFVGKLLEKPCSFFTAELYLLCGVGIVYFFGVGHLCVTMGYSIFEAVIKGVLPFVAGDILKTLIVAGIHSKFHTFFAKTFR